MSDHEVINQLISVHALEEAPSTIFYLISYPDPTE